VSEPHLPRECASLLVSRLIFASPQKFVEAQLMLALFSGRARSRLLDFRANSPGRELRIFLSLPLFAGERASGQLVSAAHTVFIYYLLSATLLLYDGADRAETRAHKQTRRCCRRCFN
jgi:hypothetical protein